MRILANSGRRADPASEILLHVGSARHPASQTFACDRRLPDPARLVVRPMSLAMDPASFMLRDKILIGDPASPELRSGVQRMDPATRAGDPATPALRSSPIGVPRVHAEVLSSSHGLILIDRTVRYDRCGMKSMRFVVHMTGSGARSDEHGGGREGFGLKPGLVGLRSSDSGAISAGFILGRRGSGVSITIRGVIYVEPVVLRVPSLRGTTW